MRRGCREEARLPENPLPCKLQIKAGKAVTALAAPPGFLRKLEPLPKDVRRTTKARGRADILLVFVRTRREAPSGAEGWKRGLAAGGILWVC